MEAPKYVVERRLQIDCSPFSSQYEGPVSGRRRICNVILQVSRFMRPVLSRFDLKSEVLRSRYQNRCECRSAIVKLVFVARFSRD